MGAHLALLSRSPALARPYVPPQDRAVQADYSPDVATKAKGGAASIDRHGLRDDQLIAILRTMLMHRRLEGRGFELNRQGKIPFASAGEGHEAVQAGAAMAFVRGKDILVPYYRDLGLDIGIGLRPVEVLLSLFGRADDHSGGRQFPHHYASKQLGLYTISSVLASQLPHAVGAAYALKYRNERDRAVLTTVGDGATSEGEWHESMNFAAIHALPVVFLCENNEWAISTPLHKQMANPNIWQRAAGYGMPGVVVDGFDPIACYAAVKEAMDRARSGNGPTFIEAKCYRFLAHTTDDDDRTYRSREEVEARRKDDPVPRFERLLVDAGILTPDSLEALKRSVLAEANEATDQAEAMPYPAPEALYEGVYSDDWHPWR
jgi:2-oxoisovalerate dehydrogenase E1 component alpha subunit